jgi:hypothetical protein
LETYWQIKKFKRQTEKKSQWSYVQDLVDIQESSGILAANTVVANHLVSSSTHKMEVKLAVHVLSKSVAEALDFLRVDVKELEQFGNEASV